MHSSLRNPGFNATKTRQHSYPLCTHKTSTLSHTLKEWYYRQFQELHIIIRCIYVNVYRSVSHPKKKKKRKPGWWMCLCMLLRSSFSPIQVFYSLFGDLFFLFETILNFFLDIHFSFFTKRKKKLDEIVVGPVSAIDALRLNETSSLSRNVYITHK